MSKIKCALKLSGLTPESKVTKAQGILNSMQGSGNFPNNQMPIGYTVLQGLIDNLQNAIIDAGTGNSSSIAYMHEQESILVSAFNIVKAHIEYVANNTATPEVIITSANLSVVPAGGPDAVTELTLDASGSGVVTVRVPRNPGDKAFVYELSTDGTTFAKTASSSLAKITITGHNPGSTIYVRYYSIGKTGESPVSQAKSVMVV